MSRGAKHWIDGPDEAAAAIGLKPLMSGAKTEDEGLFVVQHSYWQDVMQQALGRSQQPEGETPSCRSTDDPDQMPGRAVPLSRGPRAGRQGVG